MIFKPTDLERAREKKGNAYADAILSKAQKVEDFYRISIEDLNSILRERARPLSLHEQAISLFKEIRKWKRAGYQITPRADLEKRRETCNACPHAKKGILPRCKLCGCTRAKLLLATATCPDNRWPV